MPETHVFLRAQSAQETWDLPKIQLKVLPHLQVFDLKSPNNSSTAFSYVSFTGTEFTIFPCSSVAGLGVPLPSLLHTQPTSLTKGVSSLFSLSVLGKYVCLQSVQVLTSPLHFCHILWYHAQDPARHRKVQEDLCS